MDREEIPLDFQVTWTGHALDLLSDLMENTRHGAGHPAWVDRKYRESVLEAVRRLELFPDLRMRYTVAGLKCGALTLKSLPVQVFYRPVEPGELTIFECRWASLDRTGPEDFDAE